MMLSMSMRVCGFLSSSRRSKSSRSTFTGRGNVSLQRKQATTSWTRSTQGSNARILSDGLINEVDVLRHERQLAENEDKQRNPRRPDVGAATRKRARSCTIAHKWTGSERNWRCARTVAHFRRHEGSGAGGVADHIVLAIERLRHAEIADLRTDTAISIEFAASQALATDFDAIVGGQQQVLGLDVAVHDLVEVHCPRSRAAQRSNQHA